MRFSTQQHKFYGGIDLHTRSMYLCVLNQDGEVLLHRDMTVAPGPLLQAIAPYREDVVVGVECLFTWDLAGRLTELEREIVNTAKAHDAQTFYRLRSIPGVGKILALMLLYEIHDIHRFSRGQEFVSYCRLVKCAKESDGKGYGTAGAKIGNAYLKWAFTEAAVLFLRNNPGGPKYLADSRKNMARAKP